MAAIEVIPKRIITQFPFTVQKIEHLWIPLRDGTRLAARMRACPPEPTRSRSRPSSSTSPTASGTAPGDATSPCTAYFAGTGYAAVRVDMRGSGDSDGLLADEYLQANRTTPCEVIDWISRQPWCDGHVGMMGKSWGGFNCLQSRRGAAGA